MSIKVSWDNEEHTILHYEFEGAWGWSDFKQATKDAGVLLDAIDYRVGVIIDLLKSHAFPDQPLHNIKNSFSNPRHRNVGLTVIIVTNLFVTTLSDVAQKIYWRDAKNYDYKIVASLTEGRALLLKEGDIGKPNPGVAPATVPEPGAVETKIESVPTAPASPEASVGSATAGPKND